MKAIYVTTKIKENISTLILLALIFSLPFWGIVNTGWLIRLEVVFTLLTVVYFFLINGANCLRDSSFLFYLLVLFLCGLKIYPMAALIPPAGLIFGKFLISLNIKWKPINKTLLIFIIGAIIFFGKENELDTNFLSFYIACLFVCADWTKNKRQFVNNIIYILICVVVVSLLNSRAFTYASIILFIAPFFKRYISKFNLATTIYSFIFLSLILTFSITFSDGEVVKLYRQGQPDTEIFSGISNPSEGPNFIEKISNISDINRFRISRMWVEEYLLDNPQNFLLGLGENYPKIISDKLYYPAHNSFIEMAIYFGFPYLLIFIFCFYKSISKIDFINYKIIYIISFGMVLHGIFYIFLIPYYFVLCKISEAEKNLD